MLEELRDVWVGIIYRKRHEIGQSEPRPEGRDDQPYYRNLPVAALI